MSQLSRFFHAVIAVNQIDKIKSFAETTLQTKVVKATGSTTTILSTYTYDTYGMRLQYIDQTYNSQSPVRISEYSYNELGQLIRKGLGGINGSNPAVLTLGTGNSVTSGTASISATQEININADFGAASGSEVTFGILPAFLQWVDYRYNIRGQVTSINNSKLTNDGGLTNYDDNDLFGMQLLYDQADSNVGNSALYTGNVSAVKWMTQDGSGGKTNERSYKYTYDLLDRLT